MFRQTGMPRRFANLLLQLWNRPHDRVYIVRDEKGQKIQYRMADLSRGKMSHKHQATTDFPTACDRTHESTRYNTLPDHVVRLSSIAVYDIYLSLTWPFTTNKRRSVLAQFTYRFFSGLFQVTASQRASSRKKNTAWKRHIMNCMGYHLLLEIQRIHSTKIQVVSILLGFK